MTFNDMVASFQNILNRTDCSDAAATTYLQQGISRIQRECRLPSMERTLIINVEDAPLTFFPVPADLIQPIDVIVPDDCDMSRSKPLDRIPFRKLVRMSKDWWPGAYARSQGVIHIRGSLPAGNQLLFLYYGNFSDFASADSENELSASTPDLAVYAALAYAGDAFRHSAADRWEGRYQEIKGEVINMAVDLDGEGGPAAVAPLYADPDL